MGQSVPHDLPADHVLTLEQVSACIGIPAGTLRSVKRYTQLSSVPYVWFSRNPEARPQKGYKAVPLIRWLTEAFILREADIDRLVNAAFDPQIKVAIHV